MVRQDKMDFVFYFSVDQAAKIKCDNFFSFFSLISWQFQVFLKVEHSRVNDKQ